MVAFFGHVRFRPLVNRPRISDTQLQYGYPVNTFYVAHRIRIGEIPLYPELAYFIHLFYFFTIIIFIFFFISFELGERPTS